MNTITSEETKKLDHFIQLGKLSEAAKLIAEFAYFYKDADGGCDVEDCLPLVKSLAEKNLKDHFKNNLT